MSARKDGTAGSSWSKTKIIATVGPACDTREKLRDLAVAGVDVFRLNFAHGVHERLSEVVAAVRDVALDLGRPLAILGDLSGPKIRLGQIPGDSLLLAEGDQVEFVRHDGSGDPRQLTCTYAPLVDDLAVGDRVLLADGTVALRVVSKTTGDDGRAVCRVEQPGPIRSRQGVNLPGVALSTPALTEKDREDLAWGLAHEIDFVGLSFVRSHADILLLKSAIAAAAPRTVPQVVAKIEKTEAVSDLERILDATDAVMVARGDLGVEVDIARVPTLQKRIIRACKQHRIPVVTATQMLDSMTRNELPTRAEASDVANAVLDGSDAVMLSGETAVGNHPVRVVTMMDRICFEAERLVVPTRSEDARSSERTRATQVTEAVTQGASVVAEMLAADLIVVTTRSGRTAMAVSKQRTPVPVLALTDDAATARRLCLCWGVIPVHTPVVREDAATIVRFVVDWGRRTGLLEKGCRFVVVGSTDWNRPGKDSLVVHAIT